MSVYAISLKGRRETNEDKHTIILNDTNKTTNLAPINFFGIYDGHGGKFVSSYLFENLPPLFVKKDVTYPLKRSFILDAYKQLQDKLRDPSNKQLAESCGSTCLVVICNRDPITNNYMITVINTGDSRCIICRDNLGHPLTMDHKPSWPVERHRINRLGGSIYFDGDDYRIKDLSVSRAFGDLKAEPYVSYIPRIRKYKLEKNDKFLVMGCDGLWDKLSNEEVVNFIINECYDNTTNIRINKEINIAKKLGEYALFKGSTDNVTIIIIFFDRKNSYTSVHLQKPNNNINGVNSPLREDSRISTFDLP